MHQTKVIISAFLGLSILVANTVCACALALDDHQPHLSASEHHQNHDMHGLDHQAPEHGVSCTSAECPGCELDSLDREHTTVIQLADLPRLFAFEPLQRVASQTPLFLYAPPRWRHTPHTLFDVLLN